jgi:hypothetical protein
MPLAQDIQSLIDRSLAALDEAHDYYTHTRAAWRLLQQVVDRGRKFTIQSSATGTKVDQQALVSRAHWYVQNYLTSATFQQFMSLLEDYLFDLMRLWLAVYPGSLSRKQIDVETVLRSPDRSAILLAVIDRDLADLRYQRVADWFRHLDRLVTLDCPSQDEIERLAEIKATRDVMVHNKGFANAIYVSKSGSRARFKDGERVEIPEQYHRESWDLIRKVVRDVGEAVMKKA